MNPAEVRNESMNELLTAAANPPASFEEYLIQNAKVVGDLVNSYIPSATIPIWIRISMGPL